MGYEAAAAKIQDAFLAGRRERGDRRRPRRAGRRDGAGRPARAHQGPAAGLEGGRQGRQDRLHAAGRRQHRGPARHRRSRALTRMGCSGDYPGKPRRASHWCEGCFVTMLVVGRGLRLMAPCQKSGRSRRALFTPQSASACDLPQEGMEPRWLAHRQVALPPKPGKERNSGPDKMRMSHVRLRKDIKRIEAEQAKAAALETVKPARRSDRPSGRGRPPHWPREERGEGEERLRSDGLGDVGGGTGSVKPPSATRRANRPLFATSSRKVPRSTMRPPSSTRMWSALATVDSRWAMMKVVRPWRSAVERALDAGLGLHVERAGRLVEDQDRRVLEDGAGDGDALALAARQRGAALADDEGVAAGLPGR